ncbi:hypothetical protein [Pseudomonas fluorescens]|uniref:hypothetical protein n=1 Tax=Pseudomonas fluorescens TaxID=294 RepID=UPI0012414629|nr:hypothetical protein [Pseudomonas fluorescens]
MKLILLAFDYPQAWIDAAGTAYNPTAGAAVLVGVDSTPASVATAIAGITNGTLAGLTPGVNLINAVSAAAAAIDTYAKAQAVANPTKDGMADADTLNGANVKDGSLNSFEALDALSAANTARTAVDAATTATLTANVTNANAAAAASKAVVAALTGGTAAVTAFDAALAAQKATLGTPADQTAAASAKAAAETGVTAALGAVGATVTLTTLGTAAGGAPFADTAAVYAYLINTATNAVQRAAVVTELNKVATYGATFNAAADKGLAVNKAAALVLSTKATLEAIDTDAVTPLVQATDYAAKAAAAITAADTLVKAQAADTAIVTAKAVVDQYVILNKASADATAAITAFNTANVGKIAITALTGATDGTAAKDVFFFPTKVTTSDFAIGAGTAFGTGDAIVLGSSYAFNAGALSAGNNSALEVFFVKSANGTQVVIETNAVGSATAVVGADGAFTSSNDAAVINLVGVTADHLSFANGVVSYV